MIKRTLIKYWDFLPHSIKRHVVLKFCFYGPESTGKSTMAEKMAKHFQTEFVPEVAKEFITSNNFAVNDIVKIGREQMRRVREKTKTANKILFCDTDLITTQIYSQQYLGVVPELIRQLEKKNSYDLYFLFDIDVPWVSDGLRDLGNKRKEMYSVFKEALDRRKIKYVMISGDYQQREDDIRQIVESYLS
jgi:HTH-type transcriptional regulator, transcriptional repressor of NAD biosynthesis genes